MFQAVKNSYLVPFNSSFQIKKAPNGPPENTPRKKKLRKELDDIIEPMRELQRVLYAHDRYALLLIFQAMDAAGKDGTIRAVMSGINPAGCQVYSFKRPSNEELDHDFLWRTGQCLPERGRIGIFNRSYYEEVLVVRCHPGILEAQNLPYAVNKKTIWKERMESIRDHEKHLARNGTVILKFWLNVSQEEQRRRFLSRLNDKTKNWKFEPNDLRESSLWDKYMFAYEEALNATSRSWAPWYAIPADNKPFMRLAVAKIIFETLSNLNMRYPSISEEQEKEFAKIKSKLEKEHSS